MSDKYDEAAHPANPKGWSAICNPHERKVEPAASDLEAENERLRKALKQIAAMMDNDPPRVLQAQQPRPQDDEPHRARDC